MQTPKINLVKYYLSLALALNVTSVFAAPSDPGCNQETDISGNYISCNASNNEHRAYVGIVFDLDGSDGFMPDLVFGLRSLHVKSNNDVEGADFSARISYGKHDKTIEFDSARLVYVGGERDFMGNIGLGYSHAHSSVIGTAGLQGAYSRIGSDFEFGKNKFEPYLEINTLDKPNKVEQSCPTGTTLVNGVCMGPAG